MRTLFCVGVVASIVVAGMLSGAGLAQNREDGEVSLSIGIADTEELPAPPARAQRMYIEPRQVRIILGVANFHTSKTPVLVDISAIRRTFGLIIERESEIPISLDWLDQIRLNSEPFAAPPGASWVRLDPGQYLAWTIVAQRADGRAFEAGQYYLTVGFQGVRSALRNLDGTNWQGRVGESIGQWSLLVRPPDSVAERVRMHEMLGGSALARGDATSALTEYSQLLDVDPSNVNAQIAIGHIHLQEGRYRDAITSWERVAPSVRGDSQHARRLTAAYVGVGQDSKAADALRAAGFSDQSIATELEQARKGAAERPAAR